ncbi:MAG: hypothetical protein IIT86_08415 [Oscillospiraceae bacterium]|jgi:hypothetical protein|nr:hypothetical protein [Oscillospiraceae bacterium]MBR3016856.1 hypothetical protein [Clostridia bacterium]MBR3431911.1 hypothetical protein [Clostridia bacterium]NLD30553.1 hypothetical protein [Clostridiales bacterium]
MKKNNRNAAARAAVARQDMNRQNNTVRRMMAYQERMVKKPCRKKLKTGQ